MCSGCHFQVGTEISMNMTVDGAYRKSLETVFDWINKEVNTSKTQVFFRTFAPVHFRFVKFLKLVLFDISNDVNFSKYKLSCSASNPWDISYLSCHDLLLHGSL